ncbi:MAG: isoprenylcysteine carboxylmethyltransferase family protein [Alistipes sp.]|jgi:protein-S-isoprenylcysteine O-methyltransferase Ste14|nr:isoprenylcysteine carboxylmethyltransferase family protein [Alistipes sp.]
MSENVIFQLAGAGILAAFFVIFFGKMAAQKRQGMRTSLLRRGGKSRRVFVTELTLKVLVFAVYGAQIASIALDTHADILWLRVAGAFVALAGVAVFGVAVRTMADSWRTEIPEGETENRTEVETANRTDNGRTELVTRGIFRISRNPAFLGFDLMFAGVAAMFFNPVLAALTVGTAIVYHLQILQEERFLTATFGAPYTEYMARTRRYLGRRRPRLN